MSSKRYNKLITDKNPKPETFSRLISDIKKNCTVKFDESIDLSFQIVNRQKKNEINIRTSVNLPSGNGKNIKIAVVCEEDKQKSAKDAGTFSSFSSINRPLAMLFPRGTFIGFIVSLLGGCSLSKLCSPPFSGFSTSFGPPLS